MKILYTRKFYLISIVLVFFIHQESYAQDDLFTASVEANITAPTFGGLCSDGFVELEFNGGSPPFETIWTISVDSTVQELNNILELTDANEGFYSIKIIDSECQEANLNFEIECECEYECIIDEDVVQPTCESAGSINLNIECNGMLNTDYISLWNDGIAGLIRENLGPGTYCVEIETSTGCIFDKCITLEDVDYLEVKVVKHNMTKICDVGCNGSIEIEATSNQNLSYQWFDDNNTGLSTSNSISGLCTGTYKLIIHAGPCTTIKKFDICCCADDSCDEDVIVPNLEFDVIDPNSETSSNGSITVKEEPEVGTITWYENDFTGQPMQIGNGIFNLSPGTYCFRYYNSCHQEKDCFTLTNCDEQSLVESDLLTTNFCSNSNLGSIKVLLDAESYVWNTGNETNEITNLENGVYSVTITTHKNCNIEHSIEVLDLSDYEVEIGNLIVNQTCPDQSSGSISFDILNSIDDLSISWEDQLSNSSTTRSNLGVGLFTVNFDIGCDITHTKSFYISESTLHVSPTSSVQNCELSVDLNLVGSNSPFEVSWSNGDVGESISGADANNEISYLITDNIGCTMLGSISTPAPTVNHAITSACKDQNEGSNVVTVTNNTNCSITAKHKECQVCPETILIENNSNPEFEVEVENLSPGSYSLELEYCGCVKSYPFQISEILPEKEWTGETETGSANQIVCLFDLVCNDNLVGSQAQNALGNIVAQGNDPYPCCGTVDFKCGRDVVSSEKIKRKWVRTAYAKALYYGGSYAAEYCQPGIGSPPFWVNWTGKKLCKLLRICPNNLCCVAIWMPGSGDVLKVESLGNGCTLYKCIFDFSDFPDEGTFVVCDGCEIIPQNLASFINCPYTPPPPPDPSGNCTIEAVGLGALLDNLGYEANNTEGFAQSSLYEFLNETTTFESLNNRSTRYCDKIILEYCPDANDKFRLLDIISDYDCFTTPCDDVVTVQSETGENFCYVYCSNEGILDPEYPIEDAIRFWLCDKSVLINAEGTPPLYNLNCKGAKFIRFISQEYNSQVGFHAVYEDGKGQTLNGDNDLESSTTYTNFKLDFSYNDIANDINVGVKSELVNATSDKREYKVIIEDSLSYREYSFRSTGYLKNEDYHLSNGQLTISGYFDGSIQYDGLGLIQSNSRVFFVLNIDTNTGAVVPTLYSSNNSYKSYSEGVFFSKQDEVDIRVGNNSYDLSAFKSGQHIIVNDKERVVYSVDPPNGYEIEIADCQTNKDGEYVLSNLYDKFNSTGDIRGSNMMGIVDGRASLLFEAAGSIQNSCFKVRENDILVGYTFTNDIRINDKIYTSQGGSDILIVKVDKLGRIEYVNQFGNESSETIKQIESNSEFIFLGGEIANGRQTTKIGVSYFVNFSNCDISAYFTKMEDKSYSNNQVEDSKPRNQEELQNVTIYPNPATSKIYVEFGNKFHDFNNRIEISDSSSKVLIQNETSNGREEVDISSFLPGMYFVKVTFPDGTIENKKIIKL